MALKKESGTIYDSRGYLYFKTKRYELALADYNHALKLQDKDAEIYQHRGELYQAMGKQDLAQADFARARSLEKK